MSRQTKFLLVVISIICLGGVFFAGRDRVVTSWTLSSPGQARPDKTVTEKPEIVDTKATAIKRESLERLKEKWLSSGKPDYIVSEVDRLLAKESVETLLCSPELVELLNYLEQAGFGEAKLAFSDALAALFTGDQAREARAGLLALPPELAIYRIEWSFFAGQCAGPEFDKFCQELQSKSAVQEAKFGHSLAKIGSDPMAAVSNAIDASRGGGVTPHSGIIFPELFMELPDDAPFPEIEALLPADDSDPVGSFDGARDYLFRRWAKVDADNAAGYIAANPGRCPPQLFSIVSGTLADQDPQAALDWLQRIPEGNNFDAAVAGVVSRIGDLYTAQAKELISMVADPKTKQELLSMLDQQIANAARLRVN